MNEEAGPSGAGTGAVPQEVLAEAQRKFERGIQCIRTNDLEQAVELFADVLQVRTQHYGELAPECASAYYRYGSTLLYQAQDSGDVFGAGVPQDEEEGEEEEAEDKENDEKGKAPAAAAPSGSGGEDGEENEESAEGDLQLAWENLDTAKAIWAKDAENNAQQLADVHSLLCDVAMESDDFPGALAEADAALAYLSKFVQEDDRRIAEVQYKRCCALQFSDHLEGALAAVQAALDCLGKRRAVLLGKLAAPAEGEDAAKLKQESDDVAAVQDDLGEKVAELKELMASNTDTKNMIKGVFAQMAGSLAGAHAAPKQQAQQQQGVEQEGLDAASGAAAAGGVKNLGVVGRGSKRINLQPVQTNVPAAPATGAGAGEPPAKKKRSLGDLMGGDNDGETTIGFGSAPAPAPAPAGEANAGAKAAAPAGVPAFLQASSVAAVYGSAEKKAA